MHLILLTRLLYHDSLSKTINPDRETGQARKYHRAGEIVETVKIDRKLQVAVSIKIAREKAGYTKREFGKKLGLTQQGISRYEKGLIIPAADKFLEFLEA